MHSALHPWQFFAGREAEGNFFAGSQGKVNRGLTNRLWVEIRKVEGHWRFFGEAEEHSLAVNRVREEKPFRDDRLMRHALSAIVNRRLQVVEISEPDGLFPIRARRVEILDDNP